MKNKKNNKKGFTLAELLIVVAIIAVLVAIAIPVFTTQTGAFLTFALLSALVAAYKLNDEKKEAAAAKAKADAAKEAAKAAAASAAKVKEAA